MMEDSVNRLWHGFGGTPVYHEGAEDWNILIDVIQKPESIVVNASMPGVEAGDIDLSIEENVLTLKAERKAEAEGEQSRYLLRERPTGSFYRAIRLPDTIDSENIQSCYYNGVLSIDLPRAEEKKKKQIKIKVDSGAQAIEAAKK
jgi:HSP20 family protein